MLDGVLEDSRSLRPASMPPTEQLDNYLDSIRQQEHRIQRLESWLPPQGRSRRDRPQHSPSAGWRTAPWAWGISGLRLPHHTTRVITHMLGIEGGGSKSDHFPTALGLDAHHALSHRRKSTFKDWGTSP